MAAAKRIRFAKSSSIIWRTNKQITDFSRHKHFISDRRDIAGIFGVFPRNVKAPSSVSVRRRPVESMGKPIAKLESSEAEIQQCGDLVCVSTRREGGRNGGGLRFISYINLRTLNMPFQFSGLAHFMITILLLNLCYVFDIFCM